MGDKGKKDKQKLQKQQTVKNQLQERAKQEKQPKRPEQARRGPARRYLREDTCEVGRSASAWPFPSRRAPLLRAIRWQGLSSRSVDSV